MCFICQYLSNVYIDTHQLKGHLLGESLHFPVLSYFKVETWTGSLVWLAFGDFRLRLGLGTGKPAAHSLQNRCLLRGYPQPPSPFYGGQVLTGRQHQIQEKIEQNRRAQEESLRHREQLIQNLEEAKESARREKEESEELKSARKQELEAQVGPLTGRSSLSEGMRAAATGPAWTLHRGGTGFRALAYFHHLAPLPSLRSPHLFISCWCRSRSTPSLPPLWSSLPFLPTILFLSAAANILLSGPQFPIQLVPER